MRTLIEILKNIGIIVSVVITFILILFLISVLSLKDVYATSQLVNGSIPAVCERWKRDVIRFTQYEMGLDGPSSVIGSIILKESSCNPSARNSSFGATGLGQFLPGTVKHVRQLSSDLRRFNPLNPQESIHAIVVYLDWSRKTIIQRESASSKCDEFAFALSGYNGGAGWVNRDRKICANKNGCNSKVWFDNVETTSRRNRGAFRENRNYVETILKTYTPIFKERNWGGPNLCRG